MNYSKASVKKHRKTTFAQDNILFQFVFTTASITGQRSSHLSLYTLVSVKKKKNSDQASAPTFTNIASPLIFDFALRVNIEVNAATPSKIQQTGQTGSVQFVSSVK